VEEVSTGEVMGLNIRTDQSSNYANSQRKGGDWKYGHCCLAQIRIRNVEFKFPCTIISNPGCTTRYLFGYPRRTVFASVGLLMEIIAVRVWKICTFPLNVGKRVFRRNCRIWVNFRTYTNYELAQSIHR